MTKIAPYGSWASPISMDKVLSKNIGFAQIETDGKSLYWLETRPQEGGRGVIVRRDPDGAATDLLPPPFNARSKVHEYGGAAFHVVDGVIFFCNDADQRVYRMDPGRSPEPLTPEGPFRYADFSYDRRRNRLVCVREDYSAAGEEPVASIVAVPVEGLDEVEMLLSGKDFFMAPRVSPNGNRLAWIGWDHPNMPWDGTELWTAEFASDGTLNAPVLVAGGQEESVCQPAWSPEGWLHFVSDNTGWWNIHRYTGVAVENLCPIDAEFAQPPWIFGNSNYGFISEEEILCTYTSGGSWKLGRLKTEERRVVEIETPYTYFDELHIGHGEAFLIAASPQQPYTLERLSLRRNKLKTLQVSSSMPLDPGYISEPEAIEFPTAGGKTAHGFYYPPKNDEFEAPESEKPPLRVIIHGGPTAATQPILKLNIQYWTSRGIGILDINYGGSTGYGREYRQRLYRQWGVVDLQDAENGATYLADKGRVDAERLAIRGGSAGGYTALCALTFGKVFKVGASYYGVSDLEALARDTHKFEARYIDRLVGKYPEEKDLYIERSPIHHLDKADRPMVFFQGLEDKVVLPNQSEMMVEALKEKSVPVAYIPFPDEAHGFRKAENIKRATESEFFFISKVFGFTPADDIKPIPIENL